MNQPDDLQGTSRRLPRWVGIAVFFIAWGAIMVLVFVPRGSLITLPGTISHPAPAPGPTAVPQAQQR